MKRRMVSGLAFGGKPDDCLNLHELPLGVYPAIRVRVGRDTPDATLPRPFPMKTSANFNSRSRRRLDERKQAEKPKQLVGVGRVVEHLAESRKVFSG